MIYKIKPTLSLNDTGTAVTNLKAALLEILNKYQNQLGINDNDERWRTFTDEFEQWVFSTNTDDVLKLIQEKKLTVEATGKVDEPTASAINKLLELKEEMPGGEMFIVQGTVKSSENFPVEGVHVRAYGVDLRTEVFLGEMKTNDGGAYQVSYEKSSERKSADLLVRVVKLNNIDPKEVQLYQSDVLFNAPQKAIMDIVIGKEDYRGLSEFERIMADISLLLISQQLQIADLKEDEKTKDITFLEGETGWSRDKIYVLVQAAKLRNEYPVNDSAHELLYGIGRQRIQLNTVTLSVTDIGALKKAIILSMQQNIIGSYSLMEIMEFLARLEKRLTDEVLKEDDAVKISEINKLLSFTLKDADLKATFIRSYKNYKGTPQQFWNEHLPAQPGFDNPALISSLQFSNQLSVLTGNHSALIRELQVNMGLTTPKQLVSLSADEWKTVLDKTGLPPGIEDADKEKYVEKMQNKLNAAFPTQKIALMARNRELNFSDVKVNPALDNFFSKAQTFDFTSSRVTDFDNVIEAAANENSMDMEALKDKLHMLQRVFQVSPTPAAMTMLIQKNLTSAYAIANIPEQSFIKMHGEDVGEDVAKSIHARASYQATRVQYVAMMMRELTHGIMPAATPYKAQQSQVLEAIKRYIPNYDELF